MAEQKKKKKFPWGVVIYLLVCAVIGGCIGVVMGKNDVELDLMTFVWIMVSVVAAMYVHIIVHEAGHAFFGMLTGYKFLSYRVGSFMWEKGKDGKVKFSRFSLAGTGGQCLMSPPDYNGGDYPYAWYNLGGAVVNILLGLLFGAVLLFHPSDLLNILCWMMLLVGIFLGVSNGMPDPTGKVNNDGSNIVAISRSPEARRAFWLQMKCNEQLAWGTRLKDQPEEYFAPYPPESRANAMVLSMEVFAANRYWDAQEFDKGKEIMLSLVENKHVPGIYRQLMTFELAWLELLSGQPGDMVAKLEKQELQQFAKAMKNFPTILRTQYALALLRDKDEKKAADIRKAFDKMAASYPHQSEIIGERELMDLTEKKAKEA